MARGGPRGGLPGADPPLRAAGLLAALPHGAGPRAGGGPVAGDLHQGAERHRVATGPSSSSPPGSSRSPTTRRSITCAAASSTPSRSTARRTPRPRRRCRRPRSQIGARQESPLDEVEAQGAGRRIEAAIGQLRPEYRSCILLRHVEGRAYEEIADMLDLPLGTVKTYIHRARNELRQALAHLKEE